METNLAVLLRALDPACVRSVASNHLPFQLSLLGRLLRLDRLAKGYIQLCVSASQVLSKLMAPASVLRQMPHETGRFDAGPVPSPPYVMMLASGSYVVSNGAHFPSRFLDRPAISSALCSKRDGRERVLLPAFLLPLSLILV